MPTKAETITVGDPQTSIPITVRSYDDQQQEVNIDRLGMGEDKMMKSKQPKDSLFYQNVSYLPRFPYTLFTASPFSSGIAVNEAAANSINRVARLTFKPDCVIYDEEFQTILRQHCGADERRTLDDLLNSIAHRMFSIAEPVPSFPTDPRQLSVKQLRKNIPLLRMYAYPIAGHSPQRQKIKHIWEEKPADWPSDVIFRDPNNNRKGGKKPSKAELVKMYNFLFKRHKNHQREAGNDSINAAKVLAELSSNHGYSRQPFEDDQWSGSQMTMEEFAEDKPSENDEENDNDEEETASCSSNDDCPLTIALEDDSQVITFDNHNNPRTDISCIKSDADVSVPDCADVKTSADKVNDALVDIDTKCNGAVNSRYVKQEISEEDKKFSSLSTDLAADVTNDQAQAAMREQRLSASLLGKRKASVSPIFLSKKNLLLQRWQQN